MAGGLRLEDVDYWSKAVDEAGLRAATDDEQFVAAARLVLDELAQSLRVVAAVAPTDPNGDRAAMPRDDAIVAAMMIRCSKLLSALLEPAIADRMEVFSLVWRSLIESAVNTIYLTREGTPELFDSYVGYSLRLEKQLRDQVTQDVAQSDGSQPIQERILSGIEQAFQHADVDPDGVDSANRADWSGKGGIYARFKSIGWQGLYPLFKIGSHYVHGNWHDLSVHHLASNPDGYYAAPDFTPVHCQPITAAIQIVASAATVYLERRVPSSNDRSVLVDRIGVCGTKARTIDDLHERYRSRP